MVQVVLLALLATLIVGCEDDETFDRAGFSVAWTIETMEGGAPLKCDQVGAYQTAMTLTDSSGDTYEYWVSCDALFFETPEWDAAVGEGTLKLNLRDAEGGEIGDAVSATVNLESGKLRNTLPNTVFKVPREIYAPYAPTVDISFELGDGLNGLSECAETGTRYISFTLVDGAEVHHPLGTLPCETFIELNAGHIPFLAPGNGNMEIEFFNTTMETINENTIPVYLPEGDVVIGPLVLYAPPLKSPGSHALLFEWQRDGASLDPSQCDAMEIDVARLWFWLDGAKSWWSEPNWMTAPCHSVDHGVDASLVDDPQFSGIFLESFINPEDPVAMTLGFYRLDTPIGGVEAETLVHQINVGTPEKPTVIGADEDATPMIRMNAYPLETGTQGNLSIALEWERDDDTFGACDEVAVSGAAFILQNRSGVALDIGLEEGVLCRDTIRLASIPSSQSYTLSVVGLQPESGMMGWFGTCEDLTPTSNKRDAPEPAVCRIRRYPTDSQ